MHKLSILLSAVLGLFLGPALGGAQDCGHCTTLGCPVGEHKFTEGEPNRENPHSNCAAPVFIPGCANHDPCGGEEEQQARVALIDAALASDHAGMIAPAIVLFNRLHVNQERGSLQLFACNSTEEVVANLPMPNAQLLAVSSSLESKRTWAAALRSLRLPH